MNELSRQQIDDFLSKQTIGHLGTICDGRPYIVPVGYHYENQTVYFASEAGTKLAALQQDPNACFEVDEFIPELGEYRSVIGYGEAQVVADEQERRRILSSLIGRFERHAPAMSTCKDFPAHAMATGEQELVVVALPLQELNGREAA